MTLPEKYSYLADEKIEKRVAALKAHSRHPSGEPAVLPFLEAMLNDNRPHILMFPIRYGEVRWLAAEAVAAERKIQGITESVHLPKAIPLLSHEDLFAIAIDADVPLYDEWQEIYVRLRELELLPNYDIDFEPQLFGFQPES